MAFELNEILLESPTTPRWGGDAPPEERYGDLEADDDFTREARGFGWEADPDTSLTDGNESWAREFGGGDWSAPSPEGRLDAYEVETLAYELMNVTDDAQMEQFLGKLLGSVGRKVRGLAKRVVPMAAKFIQGPGRQLLARAMPMIGAAAGSIVPGLGTAMGGMAGQALGSLIGGDKAGAGQQLTSLLGSGAVGNVLGSLLGGEMESATLQEAKLDVAKRLVRSIADATADATLDPAAMSDPENAARQALGRAVRTHVPAPLRAILAASSISGGDDGNGGGQSGRWVRRGANIVLLGA